MEKLAWEGTLIGVQPRIRLGRSFDERYHTYLGYVLLVDGTVDGKLGTFGVAIGKGAQEKRQFRAGDEVSGLGVAVADPRAEAADYYKVSRLNLGARGAESHSGPPPVLGVPPDLPTYRARGHRRLAARTYAAHCTSCIWGCEMPVEIIIDHWNPRRRKYRFETFCYGPKSCPRYRPGPTRKVPGRHGMTWEEEDWVGEDATSHRGPED